ncbi:hypothetical protein GO613_02340 [Azoarcus communis]|uniref:hypothetical protein n=1 Tax=Parazoarcus communis TaxID=41977 RepID=UPI001459C941|nr:hypothetical protein [Parazoarcus communis]NMG46942.1 hypothetical protein [Parazoarcus communis]
MTLLLPDWSRTLAALYWRLRAARHCSKPHPSTWRRRILAEKKRLLDAGVDRFELHAVCVFLARGEHSVSGRRALKFLSEKSEQH